MAARQSGTQPRPSTSTVPDTNESSAPTADTTSSRPRQPSDSTLSNESRLHSSALQRGTVIARLVWPVTTGTPARRASAAPSPSPARDAEDGDDRSKSAPSSRRPSAPPASRNSAGCAASRHLSNASSPSPSVASSSPAHKSAKLEAKAQRSRPPRRDRDTGGIVGHARVEQRASSTKVPGVVRRVTARLTRAPGAAADAASTWPTGGESQDGGEAERR
jgi:hypothetical protein